MSGIENLSAGDLSPECIDVNEPELDIAEVVILECELLAEVS